MGESVEEATITKWFVKTGDTVEEDTPLLEIATDKVDSEIPSPVAGIVESVLFKVDDKVVVGSVIAIINTDATAINSPKQELIAEKKELHETVLPPKSQANASGRFYSPLVKSVAKQEGVSTEELDNISGSGEGGRLRKEDVVKYIANRKSSPASSAPVSTPQPKMDVPKVLSSSGDEIIEMDRMRKLIADHMVMSKQVSPHVTGFIEADVTHLVLWRERNKVAFEKRYGAKLTYMPVFTEVTAKALRDFPMINSSVDGTKIIVRKNVNVGIAVALPNGNLIVPVIKNTDSFNLGGLATEIQSLANKARTNKLSPDDVQGGTFTITNFGTFKNTTGTPIINQPQVAILATGTIEKKPAVLELPTGDVIAIRHKIILSLTYDHRIIDGSLGGTFLRRIADYLENFDINTAI